MNTTITTAIRQDQQSIAALGAGAAGESATVLTQKTTDASGNPQVRVERMFDPKAFTQFVQTAREAGRAGSIHSLAQQITTTLGDLDDKTSIAGQMRAMLDGLNIADASDLGARQKAVSAVTGFFDRIHADGQKLTELGRDSQGQIHNKLDEINANIRRIFDSNSQLMGRDDLIENTGRSAAENSVGLLASDVGVNYTINKGKVLVNANVGINSMNLVSETHYVQFSYDADNGKISYAFHNHDGPQSQKIDQNILNSEGKLALKCGGALEGLLDFNYNILPQAQTKLSKAASDVAEGLNVVHNKGTGFPPPTLLISARKVLSTEALINATGSAKLVPLGADGKMLASNGSDITIPSFNLPDFSDVGAMVASINKEAACSSSAGAALGSNVDGQADRHLIDQIALDIGAGFKAGNTQASFRLESGSDSDTQFRVTQIVIDDGNTAPSAIAGLNTDWMYVKAGEIAHSSKFNLTLPAPAQQTLKIAMVVEVLGSDGTFAEQRVSFTLDAGAGNNLYDHTASNYVQAEDSTAGGFVWPVGLNAARDNSASYVPAKTSSPIYSASITDDKLELGGRIAMTGDATINGKDVSAYFGLNNLVAEDTNGKWNVVDLVKSDANALALGQVTKQKNNVKQATVTGTAAATAELSLSAGQPNDNETITVNGQVFTLKVALTNPAVDNEVLIGANAAGTITNLVAKLNSSSFPAVSSLMTFTVNGGDPEKMDVAAKHMGTKGNSISLAHAATNLVWNNTANPAGGATSLDDGADAAAGTRSATRYGYEIVSENNNNVPAFADPVKIGDSTVTLKNAFMNSALDVKAFGDDAKAADDIASEAAAVSHQLFQDSRKLDEGSLVILISKMVQHMRTLYAVQRLLMEGQKMTAAMAA